VAARGRRPCSLGARGVEDAVLIGLVAATLRLMTPILFATLGEMVVQRAGVLNVGVEGMMLVGAFAGVAGAVWTDSPWGGLAIAIAAAMALSAVHAVLCIRFETDQIVSGIALAILGLGLSGFGYRLIFSAGQGVKVPTFGSLALGPLAEIPYLGPMLFDHHALVYIGLAAAALLAWFMRRTYWGLAIRACGESPEAAHAAGIDVQRTRYAVILFGGAMAGIGGAYLSLAQIGNFVENMVAGRGFIAIACVVYGRWNAWGVLLATLFFGFVDAAQIRLQSYFADIPFQFFVMLPYALAIGALVLFSRRTRMPAALGRTFAPGR
jgi:ABC-type uncharacterized transport system permease subunit